MSTNQIIKALHQCSTCSNTILQSTIITPLYHCLKCQKNRRSLAVQLNIKTHKKLLTNFLQLHIRDWSSWQYNDGAEPASTSAVHLLVLSTEDTTASLMVRSIVELALDMLQHSFRLLDTPINTLLTTSAAAWIRALPAVCSTQRMTAILNILDDHYDAFLPSFDMTSALSSTFPNQFHSCGSIDSFWNSNNNGVSIDDLVLPGNKRQKTQSTTATSSSSSSSTTILPKLLPQLPTDVLLVMFEFLTPARIMHGCALINQDMAIICHAPWLWKRIYRTKYSETYCHEKCCSHKNAQQNRGKDEKKDLHDWKKMYITRRGKIKQFNSKKKYRNKREMNKGIYITIGKTWKSAKKRRSKLFTEKLGRRTLYSNRKVPMCNCCGCNFIAMDQMEMLMHYVDNSKSHILGRSKWSKERAIEFFTVIEQHMRVPVGRRDSVGYDAPLNGFGKEGKKLLKIVMKKEKWDLKTEQEYRKVMDRLKRLIPTLTLNS